MSDINQIQQAITKFRDDRNWKQFHSPKEIAICLNVEASELLELYLWKKSEEVEKDKVKEELADVFYAAFLLAKMYDFDVKDIVNEKLNKNALKYPVEKARDSNKKYNEY